MRRIAVVAVCVAMAAVGAYAQTNVLSQNAVGYVKVSVPAGLQLVSQDFVDIDGNPQSPSTVINDQMPVGARLFVWNVGLQQFDIENYEAGKKGNPDSWNPDTAALEPGVGFFLESPSAADVMLLGEVPDAATTDLSKTEGLALFGFPYPATQSWTGTALATSALVGDRLFTWNVGLQQYDIANYEAGKKGNPDSWSNPSDTIAPGQGYFYESGDSNTVVVTETKPYTWP